MDPAAAAAAEAKLAILINYLQHQRTIADYFFIVSPAIMIYDWFLCLSDEVQLVWFSPWSYTKVLFFLVRYLPFVSIYFDLHNQLLLNVTPQQCEWTFPTLMWIMTLSMNFAVVVLAIRTWAVFRRDRVVGAVLLVSMITAFVLACYYNWKFNHTLTFADPPYNPGFRGCFVTHASTVLRVDFIASAALEFIALCLMALSAFRAYKVGDRNQLSTVLHRDGIIYYIFLLGASIANVSVMSAAPADLEFMMIPVCGALYTVLTSRIVLNIRNVGRKDTLVGTQLHTYAGSNQSPMPMVFRSAPSHGRKVDEEDTIMEWQ